MRLALEAGEMGAWEYRIGEGRVIWSETLERIHGLEPGTFGGTFDDYQRDIHPDDRSHVIETVTHTLTGAPHRLRYRIIRPDGAVRWVEARGTLVTDGKGAPNRIVGICMDVTEREQSEEAMNAQRVELERQTEALQALNIELQHTNDELAAKTRLAEQSRAEAEAANRSKADFLAHMSHELRTPLNAIAGYSELMELGLHGPLTPEQTEDLRRIKRSQRHLLSLINDVLNFAKLEAAHVSYDIKPVAVHETVSSLEALIAPQVARKHLRYEPAQIDSAIHAWGDAEKIQQILLNLLSNAVKFTEPGGRITVTAARVDNIVCIEVADTGCGIPANKQQSVFEPFVQLERTLSSPHQGTGLGLAISRDLARGMHGELTVDSAPGEGSTFQLRLPANDG
ncbi:MAG: PAS domain-containing protein [Gemmatimonadaceae bacterium]|nr:PAS domain-containing protein [Gemmatimonadaceae bacterium]